MNLAQSYLLGIKGMRHQKEGNWWDSWNSTVILCNFDGWMLYKKKIHSMSEAMMWIPKNEPFLSAANLGKYLGQIIFF